MSGAIGSNNDTIGVPPGPAASETTFNADGSITETREGVSVTTTINADGSVTDVYGPPINQTWLTTFSGSSVSTARTA